METVVNQPVVNPDAPLISPTARNVNGWQSTAELLLCVVVGQRQLLCSSLCFFPKGNCIQWQVSMEVKMPSSLASIWDICEGQSECQRSYSFDPGLSCTAACQFYSSCPVPLPFPTVTFWELSLIYLEADLFIKVCSLGYLNKDNVLSFTFLYRCMLSRPFFLFASVFKNPFLSSEKKMRTSFCSVLNCIRSAVQLVLLIHSVQIFSF